MNIRIICIGKLKERFYSDAEKEYLKRLSRYAVVEVIELADEKAPEQLSEAQKQQVKNAEGKRILSRIGETDYLIATAIEGKTFTSERLASHIDECMSNGKSRIAIAIGGSLGLSSAVLLRANLVLSFSTMTFTHQLFRIMLLEQLYRTYKIINNEPYHK